MKSKFEDFLEKLNIEDSLKSSIKDGFNSILESLASTSSSTGYNTITITDSSGSIQLVPDPSGYNGGHNTVDDEELEANEGEDHPFEFKLPSLVGQNESDVQDIKDKFKSFLNKLHSMGDKKNLTEAIMEAIDILFEDLSTSGYGMGMISYDFDGGDGAADVNNHHHGAGAKHSHLKNKKLIGANKRIKEAKNFKFVLNTLANKYSK